MDILNKYPQLDQLVHEPAEYDGYVAASHLPRSVSANAFALHLRNAAKPITAPKTHASDDISSQERGIFWGIIGLLQMCSSDSILNIYTTSNSAICALNGRHARRENLELIDAVLEISKEKRIAMKPTRVTQKDRSRWIRVELLRQLAKRTRDGAAPNAPRSGDL